jgi:hypothetical protein
MPVSAFEPRDDFGVTCANMIFCHACWTTSLGYTASGTRDNAWRRDEQLGQGV